jgi:hypothetical protein
MESFLGKRNIGDRRRAQRILKNNPVATVSEEVEEPLNEAIVPIESVSNRTDGDAPVRSASRSRNASTKRNNSKKLGSKPEKAQHVVVTASQHVINPLAGLDRSQFIRKSSHEQ